MKFLLVIMVLLVSCGTEKVDKRTKHREDPEITKLKEQVLALQGTIAQINAFTANDFSDCDSGLPPFETKICEIAQTATAEQSIRFKSQLSEVVKIYQDELYGEDCINDTDPGCPVTGSILDQLDDVADHSTDIAALQSDVLQLQSDLAAVESRLDDFNGSGNSIETVITAIQNDIVLIESRLDDLEAVVDSGDVFKTIEICDDIVNSGPIYETFLMTGDRLKVIGYLQETIGKRGLGTVKEYGDILGDVYEQTTLNTRRCRFKVYEDTVESYLRICWNNTNRNASSASIDTECDSANDFASPTADCTCK